MNIRLRHGLPYVSVSLSHLGKQALLKNTLIDTGSTGTVFSIDKVIPLGLQAEPDDPIREIRGVGGTEFVFIKQIDFLSFGDFIVNDFKIEIGAMNYGFDIDGIIGLDVLLQAKVIIDFKQMIIQ
jgi:hypothetical protein